MPESIKENYRQKQTKSKVPMASILSRKTNVFVSNLINDIYSNKRPENQDN